MAVLALDRYAVTPLLDARAATRDKRARLEAEKAQADNLLSRGHRLEGKWRGMIDNGLKGDAAEAERQMLRSLVNWSAKARLGLSDMRPERAAGKEGPAKVSIRCAGTGSMRAVRDMLKEIESAKIPIRITEFQLGSRKDGTDSLSMTFTVSTLYAPPHAVAAEGSDGGATPAGETR